MIDKIFGVIHEIVDNDTLIIIFMSALAFYSPDHRELIAAALVGYLGGKKQPVK
jgi:hypothetical protein